MTAIAHRPGCWIDPESGSEIGHVELMRRMAAMQVVMLGETHDRFDVHRWQLHVAAGLHALRPDMAMGFEMFPRRVQPALDAWVSGALEPDAFLESAEWKAVWNFAPELYLPLFHFCRQFKIPMLALNCRRALVTEVGKMGWDAIPHADRDGVSPAKDASDGYRQYLFDILSGMRTRDADYAASPEFARFVRAQQTWDRAFACGIADALSKPNPPLVVGIIGSGISSTDTARRASLPACQLAISASAIQPSGCRRIKIHFTARRRSVSPMRCSGSTPTMPPQGKMRGKNLAASGRRPPDRPFRFRARGREALRTAPDVPYQRGSAGVVQW